MKFGRKPTPVRSRTANRVGFRKHSKVDWYLEECNNEQTLHMLYDDSAFTWEGMSCDSYNLDAICDSFEEDGLWTNPDAPVVFYVTKGRDMNRMEHLTGTNAYPDDLNILSIMNDQLRINAMIPIQFNYGARWMDDIIDNNRMREEEGGMGFYSRCKTAAEDISWVCWQFEYEPEVCFQSDIDYYFKIIKNVNEAWAFNYHSDYWGSADEYQQANVDLMEMLEPYIGKMVRFDSYIDGEHTLVGIAIDKQYNSVSHTRIVLADERDASNKKNSKRHSGSFKRAYVGEFTQHDMEFLYEHGFEDSALCGHGDSDGTIWCRDFPGGYDYIMINIDGAYGYGIADSSGDEESVYGMDSIYECDCNTIEEAYSHIASRRKRAVRRKTANGAYRYITNFRLLAPVNDIVAARDYLDEPMEEYLKNSVGYAGLTEYTLSKVDTIKWVLLDDESGQIVLTCNSEMSQDELDLISIWVRGQCSDGIGEGFEQQDFSGYPEPVWEDFYDDELYEEEYDEWLNSPSMSSFDYRTNDYKFVFDGIV